MRKPLSLKRTQAGRAMKGTFRENDETLAGSRGAGGGPWRTGGHKAVDSFVQRAVSARHRNGIASSPRQRGEQLARVAGPRRFHQPRRAAGSAQMGSAAAHAAAAPRPACGLSTTSRRVDAVTPPVEAPAAPAPPRPSGLVNPGS